MDLANRCEGAAAQVGRRLIARLALGLAIGWLAHGLDVWVPASADEPLALRWLRALAAHPVRGGLAIGLLGIALLPWPREGEPSSEPSAVRSRADPDAPRPPA